MPYDDALAERVRALLGDLVAARGLGPVEEKRMFGGLSFLVGGRLATAVSGRGGLLVPTGPEAAALLLEGPDDAVVRPMVMGSRTSRSWVHVLAPAVASEDGLREWVERGLRQVSGR